jgi:hypothetical protein
MSNAKSLEPTLNLSSLPKPVHMRVISDDGTAPEALHWALRASLRALVSPRVWFGAFAPARN